jgi:hypothetical protein
MMDNIVKNLCINVKSSDSDTGEQQEMVSWIKFFLYLPDKTPGTI